MISHIQKGYRKRPTSEELEELRGTGRTTACICRAIAAALAHPNKWRVFRDHEPMDLTAKQEFVIRLTEIARRLQLTIDVQLKGGRVLVRSPVERIRREAELDNVAIDRRELSERAVTALDKTTIFTHGDLARCSVKRLLATKGCGTLTIREILKYAARHGIAIRPNQPD